MANIPKKGLAYYSCDTDRYQDMKIKKLKKQMGCSGLAIWDYVLNEIYRVQGSFIEWDENTVFDVSEYFNIKESLVNEVINYCCNVGLIDKELRANESVLTSKAIQERYVRVCKQSKRKIINIPEEIKLIREEMPKPPEEIPKTPEEKTQSKVKKKKYIKKNVLSYEYINDNGDHRSIETDEDFINLWNAMRCHYLKKPSHLARLSVNCKINLKELKKTFGIIDFINAMKGFFKNLKPEYQSLTPGHFLNIDFFQKYLDAGVNNYDPYPERKNKEVRL